MGKPPVASGPPHANSRGRPRGRPQPTSIFVIPQTFVPRSSSLSVLTLTLFVLFIPLHSSSSSSSSSSNTIRFPIHRRRQQDKKHCCYLPHTPPECLPTSSRKTRPRAQCLPSVPRRLSALSTREPPAPASSSSTRPAKLSPCTRLSLSNTIPILGKYDSFVSPHRACARPLELCFLQMMKSASSVGDFCTRLLSNCFLPRLCY